MRRRTITISLALAAILPVALPAAAPAASGTAKAKKRPAITRVSPMRVRVGAVLTIRGRNFKSSRRKNTVIFRASNGRTAFAKPRRASRRKLVVMVPPAVGRMLAAKPTRIKIRVLAGRFSAFTSNRLSPVVVPSNFKGGIGGGPGASECAKASFDDGDLLGPALENSIGTDSCIADTDGDGLSDGWEYYAAKDLNVKAVPYPGKRPFPNALDPSDPGIDFDGDGLTGREEYRAWRHTGSSFIASKAGGADLESPLGYSDGTKFSRASETPAVPAWKSASYGRPNPAQPFPATLNLQGDAAWQDDERDADKDGLANWLESDQGPRDNVWWAAFFAGEQFDPNVEPHDKASYCGFRFGHFEGRPFAELNLADADVDGDSLLDGEDDQDADDFTNITELYEVEYDLDGNGNPAFCFNPDLNEGEGGLTWGPGVVPSIDRDGVISPVNAMNPCAPNPRSRTCPSRVGL